MNMTAPMNWLRGFRRLYFLLAAVWITGSLLYVAAGRKQPWRNNLPQWVKENETLRPSDWQKPGLTPEQFLHNEALTEIAKRKLIWTLGLALAPPVMTYVLVFYVVPWVFRGFRPSTQI